MEFKVFITPDEQGGYTAVIPALEYCMSWGSSVEEALTNVQEAMEGVVETMEAHHIIIPQHHQIIETSITYPSFRMSAQQPHTV